MTISPTLEIRSDLGPHRDRWDELVAAGRPPIPNLRSWYLDAVQRPSTRYVLVVASGRLLGGVVVDRRDRYPGVPVIGPPGGYFNPPHFDLLADPAHEYDVLWLVASWFRSHRQAIVSLPTLREGSLLGRVLPGRKVVEHDTRAPYLVLPPTFEEYLTERSKNWRSSLRRNSERLAANGFLHRRLAADEVGFGIRWLRRLHAQVHGDDSAFLPHYDAFERIVVAGVTAGEAEFHVLARDDRVAAIDVVFVIEGFADDFQSGRDVSAPDAAGAGSVLVAKVVEYGCQQGWKEIDLEYPDHEYKRRMTDRVRQLENAQARWGLVPRVEQRIRDGLPPSVEERARALARWGRRSV